MRLADHISFIALVIMAMMILILLMPDTMYGSNYHELIQGVQAAFLQINSVS